MRENNTAAREGLTLTNVTINRRPITTARFSPKDTAGRWAFDFLTDHGPRFDVLGTAANADAPMPAGGTTNMVLLQSVNGCAQSWIRLADCLVKFATTVDPMTVANTHAKEKKAHAKVVAEANEYWSCLDLVRSSDLLNGECAAVEPM